MKLYVGRIQLRMIQHHIVKRIETWCSWNMWYWCRWVIRSSKLNSTAWSLDLHWPVHTMTSQVVRGLAAPLSVGSTVDKIRRTCWNTRAVNISNLIDCRVWQCFTHCKDFVNQIVSLQKTSRKTLTSNPSETHIPIAVRPRVGRWNGRGWSTMKILHHIISSCLHLFTIWLRMDSGSWNYLYWCLGNMEGTRMNMKMDPLTFSKHSNWKYLKVVRVSSNAWSSLLESCMLCMWGESTTRQTAGAKTARSPGPRGCLDADERAVDVYGRFMIV